MYILNNLIDLRGLRQLQNLFCCNNLLEVDYRKLLLVMHRLLVEV